MRTRHFLIERLKENLAALLRQNYSSRQLNEVVTLSHSIVVSFLETKFAHGSLNKEFLHLSICDAAYDCIAELFRRNDEGRLLAFNAYFAAFPIDALEETEIFSHLRRLVFTKVNDGIVRSGHSPARLPRNVRLAVQSLGSFAEIERFGEIFLTPIRCDTLEHLPKFDEQSLEEMFIHCVRGDENVLEMVGKLSAVLRNQNAFARMVNVLQIAYVIRTIYSRKALSEYTLSSSESDSKKEDELFQVIEYVAARTKHRMNERYVSNGKIDAQTFAQYFSVIESKLQHTIFSGSLDGQSLFSSLKKFIPLLTEQDYKKCHRAKLEYLFKLTCDEVAKELRK